MCRHVRQLGTCKWSKGEESVSSMLWNERDGEMEDEEGYVV